MSGDEHNTSSRYSSERHIIAVLKPTVGSQKAYIDEEKWTVFDDHDQSRFVHYGFDKTFSEEVANHLGVNAPFGAALPSGEPQESPTVDTFDGKQQQISNARQIPQTYGIAVDLNQCTKGKDGFVCGRYGHMADLIIPAHFSSVSNCHFSITFNDDYQLIIRDLNSSLGTDVLFDGHSEGVRRNGAWVIGDSDILQNVSRITIRIPNNVGFDVEVEPFDPKCPDFRRKVDKFLQRSVVLDSRLCSSDNQSDWIPTFPARTRIPEAINGVGRELIGRGGCSVVHLVIAINGKRWVEKTPILDLDSHLVIKEAELLSRVSHENIIEFLDFKATPTPALALEYIPGGTLDSHLQEGLYFSWAESLEIARQTTSAVTFLHGLDPKITHCDIAAANIYIQERTNSHIFVKLAGFELGELGSGPKTFRGTTVYIAPEMYTVSAKCTEYVDIWSLGIVLVEISFGLPELPRDRNREWCYREWCYQVVNHLEALTTATKGPTETFRRFLLEHMLQINPEHRRSAQRCHYYFTNLDMRSGNIWMPRTLVGLSTDADETSIQGNLRQELLAGPLSKTVDIGLFTENRVTPNVSTIVVKDYDRDSGYTSASRSNLPNSSSESILRGDVFDSETEIVDNHDQQPYSVELVASNDDDIDSQASHETTRRERDGKALIMLFLAEDQYIRGFCGKAMVQLAEQQVVETMRKLLKMFHKNLMEEAVGEVQRTTAKLLRSRRGRVRISQSLLEHLRGSKDDLLDQGDARPWPTQEGKIGVEAWLTQVSSVDEDVDNRLSVAEGDHEAVALLVDESDSEDEFPHIADLKSFLRESTSFRLLQRNSMLQLLPYTLRHILLSSPRGSVWLSQEQDVSFSNRFKSWVEDSTELEWDWRPFSRRKRLLRDNESRLFWRCTCDIERWEEVSLEQHDIISKFLEISQKLETIQPCVKKRRHSHYAAFSHRIWNFLGSQATVAPSAAAQRYTPQQRPECQVQLPETGYSAFSSINTLVEKCRSSNSALASRSQTAAASEARSKPDSWILFGVKGPRRTLTLAQVPISSTDTDYEGFQALKTCYEKHRGRLRMWFSIWRLGNCQVVKFNKLTQDRLLREYRDLPSHQEYIYSPRAGATEAKNPPVPHNAFDAFFYSCKPSCAWVLPHDCLNLQSGSMYLERIPKRERDFMKEERAPIWGFEAVYSVSWRHVAFYHATMVLGPLVFWLCWLKAHPGDWQNAAVPITVVLGALSLFWSAAGILTAKKTGKDL